LGGLLISLSAFYASRKLFTLTAKRFTRVQVWTAFILFVWAAFWWLGTGLKETEDRLAGSDEETVFLMFLSLSMLAAGILGKKLQWNWFRWTSMTFLPLIVWLGIHSTESYHHLLFGLGWIAWPMAWVVQVFVLRLLDENKERLAGVWHFATITGLCLFLSLDSAWWTQRFTSAGWAAAVASVIPGVMAMLIWRFKSKPAWPVPRHPQAYFLASILLVAAQAIFLSWSSLIQPGDPHPLPYLPILNPFDLATLFAALTAYVSVATLKQQGQSIDYLDMKQVVRIYQLLLAMLFFILTTFALVRGVHYYTDVPWGLKQLHRSDVVQTALSIYWGLLGFGGMILGARRASRTIWFVGVAFMALVVIKLFAVDLGNSGTIERIISFIGIGVLLLVVGYFAPAPPRGKSHTTPNEPKTAQPGEKKND